MLNNPLKYSDPSGEDPVTILLNLGGTPLYGHKQTGSSFGAPEIAGIVVGAGMIARGVYIIAQTQVAAAVVTPVAAAAGGSAAAGAAAGSTAAGVSAAIPIIGAVIAVALWVNAAATSSQQANAANNQLSSSAAGITNTSNNANFATPQTVNASDGMTANMTGGGSLHYGGCSVGESAVQSIVAEEFGEARTAPRNLFVYINSNLDKVKATNAKSISGGYGNNWIILAGQDISELDNIIKLIPNGSYDNIVYNAHGGQSLSNGMPVDVQFHVRDGGSGGLTVGVNSDDITKYNAGKYNSTQLYIDAMKHLMSKTKTGGNFVFAVCDIANSSLILGDNGNASGMLINALSKLSENRLNIALNYHESRIDAFGLNPYTLPWHNRTLSYEASPSQWLIKSGANAPRNIGDILLFDSQYIPLFIK